MLKWKTWAINEEKCNNIIHKYVNDEWREKMFYDVVWNVLPLCLTLKLIKIFHKNRILIK